MERNIRFIKSVSKANPLPVAALDSHEQAVLIYSNGLAEKLLGYEKKDLFKLSDNNFEAIIHPEDYKEFLQKTNEVYSSEEGEIIEFSFRIRKADGNYLHWLSRNIVFERNINEHSIKYASVIQDITEVVHLEKQISVMVQKLNQVSFKNSHELRGPVASILGLMEVMKMEDFQSIYNQKIFKHLESTVSKLDKVIKDISNITYN